MDRLLITVILLFIMRISFAQEFTPPKPNSNIKNKSLKRFEGVWQWEYATDTIKMILRKENILLFSDENIKKDVIIGYHMYKRGKEILGSSLSYADSISGTHYTIYGNNRKGRRSKGGDTLYTMITDPNIFNRILGDLTLVLNKNRDQLQWTITHKTETFNIIRKGQEHFYDKKYNLPKSIVLRKVNK